MDEDTNAEPAEGDLVTTDGVHFLRRGELVFTVQVREAPRKIGERGVKWRDADIDEVTPSAAWGQLERWMHKRRIRGANVWRVDEEAGEYVLMERPARHRRQSAAARAKYLLAVAAAERKYGDERDDWPDHVARQIQRLSERR